MNILAMDISKDEIVCFVDGPGETFSFPNTFDGATSFLQDHGLDPTDTLVGCESTGDYHNVPCLAALKLGYQVKVLNPLLIKQVINATVRKKKTDHSDARIIAKLLKDGHGETVSEASFSKTRRTMLRTEQKIVQCASDLKRVYKSLQEKSKVMDVSEAMRAVKHCIEVLKEESDELQTKATQDQSRQEQIIDSIPGFGIKLAAIVSEEAGDITRFPSPAQFKAYVGIDPKVSQSGQSTHTGKITKRGNPNLRYALYLAANISRQYDPQLKAFYDKKRSENKSHRHATCAIVRKLCERIYAIVLKNREYEVRMV